MKVNTNGKVNLKKKYKRIISIHSHWKVYDVK